MAQSVIPRTVTSVTLVNSEISNEVVRKYPGLDTKSGSDNFVPDPIESAIAAMSKRPRSRESRSNSLPAAYLFPDAAPVAEEPYGWVIVVAVFFIHVIVDGLTYSFGALYPDLLEYYSGSGVDTNLTISILIGITYGCGPLASHLCLKYGLRTIALIGSILACGGCLLSLVTTSIWQLTLTYGALTGLGFGFMYLPAIVSVASWFEERRAIATSIAVCGSGVGTFIFAPLTTYLLNQYTLFGTLVIMAGITLNGAVFAMMLRTPPRHEASEKLRSLKKKASQAMKSAEKEPCFVRCSKFLSDNIDWRLLGNWRFLVYCGGSFLGGISSYVPYVYLSERAKEEAGIEELNASFLISIVGIANIFGRLSSGVCSLTEKLCVDELIFYSTACIVAGVATGLSVYCADYIQFAVYAAIFGYTGAFRKPEKFSAEFQVNNATTRNFGEVVRNGNSKYSTVRLNKHRRAEGELSACIIVALQSVVLTDIVGVERISRAFGILLFVQGIAVFVGPPLAGYLVDISGGSYHLCFIVIGCLMAASGLALLPIPLHKLFRHLRDRRIYRESESTKDTYL